MRQSGGDGFRTPNLRLRKAGRSSRVHVARADVIANACCGDRDAAETSAAISRSLRRHPAAGVPHLVFPREVRALEAVFVEVGIAAAGQDVSPCGFERIAGLLEARRNTMGADTALRERKEPAVPAPLLGILRDARALADPSDFDVAIENAPTLAVSVLIAAASKGGHRP
jgi:hypothetical protein